MIKNDYMIPMNNDIVKNKYNSVYDFLKYIVYFHNFYLYHNISFIIINILILYFIEGSGIQKIFTFIIAGGSSWFFHWFAHKCRLFNLISGHKLHHKKDTTFFEDTHEFISDVFAAGLGLMIINYSIRFAGNFFFRKPKKFLFNNYILLFFMIAFPLVHLITYHSILEKSYHQEHHDKTDTNLSPDYFDHIFNTNLDNRIEDISHMVPIFLVVGICTILIQKYKIITFE